VLKTDTDRIHYQRRGPDRDTGIPAIVTTVAPITQKRGALPHAGLHDGPHDRELVENPDDDGTCGPRLAIAATIAALSSTKHPTRRNRSIRIDALPSVETHQSTRVS
jgi:hypothetical protein